jgi:UDP-N-acetylmuramate--alanine ligase
MLPDLTALFGEMGRTCPHITILPVYYAGGTPTASTTAETLVAEAARLGAPVELAPTYDALIEAIAQRARPGDVVLSMGARDPDLPALAQSIVEAIGASSHDS